MSASARRADDILPRKRLLLGWPSSVYLIDWLCDRIDTQQLHDIASDDHERHEQHEAAMRAMVEQRVFPDQLEWHPREVLSLHRWASPSHKENLTRPFAAAVLTLYDCDTHANAPILIDSLLPHGHEALRLASALFVRCYECGDDANEAVVSLVAALVVALHVGHHHRQVLALLDQLLHEALVLDQSRARSRVGDVEYVARALSRSLAGSSRNSWSRVLRACLQLHPPKRVRELLGHCWTKVG